MAHSKPIFEYFIDKKIMLFSSHQLEDFIKTKIINGNTKQSPLVINLNNTGLDIEGLSAVSCISKSILHKYIETASPPTKSEMFCLDTAFDLPQGTFKLEYDLWTQSIPRSAHSKKK